MVGLVHSPNFSRSVWWVIGWQAKSAVRCELFASLWLAVQSWKSVLHLYTRPKRYYNPKLVLIVIPFKVIKIDCGISDVMFKPTNLALHLSQGWGRH